MAKRYDAINSSLHRTRIIECLLDYYGNERVIIENTTDITVILAGGKSFKFRMLSEGLSLTYFYSDGSEAFTDSVNINKLDVILDDTFVILCWRCNERAGGNVATSSNALIMWTLTNSGHILVYVYKNSSTTNLRNLDTKNEFGLEGVFGRDFSCKPYDCLTPSGKLVKTKLYVRGTSSFNCFVGDGENEIACLQKIYGASSLKNGSGPNFELLPGYINTTFFIDIDE